MEPAIKFFGRIVQGQLRYYKPTERAQYIASMEGIEFEEIIQPKHVPVSEDQYGYYFGGIIGTCLQTETFGGWHKNEIDEYFCSKYLSYTKVIIVNGMPKQQTITPSKTRISRKKMAEFIDYVLNELATMGIFPPAPEEFITNKYKTTVKHGKERKQEPGTEK